MTDKTTGTRQSGINKKVSFRINTEERSQPANSTSTQENITNVEISPFPHEEIKSILRLNLSSLSTHREDAPESSRRKNKKVLKVPEVKVRTPKREQSFKQPTETVKHALLRAMSHSQPDEAVRQFLSKTLITRPTKLGRGYQQQQTSNKSTPRSSGSSYIDSDSQFSIPNVRIFCGRCERSKRNIPAAGFCKYCSEYLCDRCVDHHKGRLTKTHHVTVFFCKECMKMDILNGKDSGYCVSCRHFYCSECVVPHCTVTGHGILEGDDLLDVVKYINER